MKRTRFVPALAFSALTRWYDPVLSAFLPEARVRRALVERMDLKPGQRVLDVGCGTGTLLVAMHAACPRAEFTGLDIDPAILEIAHRKIAHANAPIVLVQCDATQQAFSGGSFERVVSSLVFHHLSASSHESTLRRMWEILAPRGELHLIDWGPPRGSLPRAAAIVERLADGWACTADSFRGRIPDLLRRAGFESVETLQRIETRVGAIEHFRATR